MRYTKVTDPVWNDKDKGSITCMVTFEQWIDPQPFHAWIGDPEPYGRLIYLECVFGLHGEIKEKPPTEIKGMKKWLSGLKKVVLGK